MVKRRPLWLGPGPHWRGNVPFSFALPPTEKKMYDEGVPLIAFGMLAAAAMVIVVIGGVYAGTAEVVKIVV